MGIYIVRNFSATLHNFSIYEMIENYFECKIDEDIAFIEYKHTPAEVIDICCLYNDDLNKVIQRVLLVYNT